MQQISKTKVKLFSSLRLKKNRQRLGMFLAEGRKLVDEAIKSGWKLEAILIREDRLDEYSSLAVPEKTFFIDEGAFSQLQSLQQSEGILAVVHFPERGEKVGTEVQGPAFLLEEIQDPGNMGTLIRTAAWFGFKDIYCSKGSVDAFNPKVLRASMGGIFQVQIHYLDDWQETLQGIRERIYIGHLEGQDLDQAQLNPDGLILIGNEARGVDAQWLEDPVVKKIYIPGARQAESLNAAIAGSILAWELYKSGR